MNVRTSRVSGAAARPVALRSVRLQAREPGGDLLAGALDRQVVEGLTERFLPMLIVPPDSVGAMIGRLRGTNLWAQRLTVRFPDGAVEEGYRALLGVAAFHDADCRLLPRPA